MAKLDMLDGVAMLRMTGEPDREVSYVIEIFQPDIPAAPGLLGLRDISGYLTSDMDPAAFFAYANNEAILELEDGREAEILFHGEIGHFVVNGLPDL